MRASMLPCKRDIRKKVNLLKAGKCADTMWSLKWSSFGALIADMTSCWLLELEDLEYPQQYADYAEPVNNQDLLQEKEPCAMQGWQLHIART